MSVVRTAVLFALAVTVIGTPAFATELGDPAPALKIRDWIKGQPVDLAAGKGKNVFVVEFWATWCGPCRKSIPHLTELQKKFKDRGVVVVGVSSEEDAAVVKKFVDAQGAKMEYVVALDDRNATSKLYMDAFNQKGIPHAFVIDKDGRLAYQGHPLFGLDEVVEAVLAGKTDAAQLQAIGEKAQREFAQRMEAQEKLMTEYFQLVTSTADAKASPLGEKIYEIIKDDPEQLNALSWTILTEPQVQTRDLPLALKAAERANKLTEELNAPILDTYARALWDTGKKDEAVKMQRKAVAVATQPQMKAELEKTLQQYEGQGKP